MDNLSKRKKRKANIWITVIFAAAIFVVFNIMLKTLAQKVQLSFDMTPNKLFVLSDETQTSLIREEFFDIDYSIDSELTASFCAPVDCDKYLWKITDLGAREPLSDAKNTYCWGTRSISVYFPTDSENIFYKRFLENNERQVHFTLTLTVKLGEKTYEDSTTLRIFKSNSSQE